MENATKDKHNKTVRVGSKIKVLSIDKSLLSSLPSDEVRSLESMVGEVLIVNEIDDCGFAHVEKSWELDSDNYLSHSIALANNEMLLIE